MVTRDSVLESAGLLVNGAREQSYGHPRDSFTRIARLWSVIIGKDIDCTDVALMLALLKVSRLVNDRGHIDSWVDLCGYASLGGELSCNGKGTDK